MKTLKERKAEREERARLAAENPGYPHAEHVDDDGNQVDVEGVTDIEEEKPAKDVKPKAPTKPTFGPKTAA